MKEIRVVIADDHPIVRDGLKLHLGLQPEITVVGEAGTGLEALAKIDDLRPKLVILDIGMPEMNGIECTREIMTRYDDIDVIILSIHGTSEYIIRAIQAGAKGYLLKDSLSQEILRAIQVVNNGRYFISQKIAARLATLDLEVDNLNRTKSPLAHLTPQEGKVLQFVVEGQTSAEIADLLFLSPKTVETYRSRIMAKLGVDNIPELVKFAIIHGVTSLDI